MKDFTRSGLVLKHYRKRTTMTQAQFVASLDKNLHVQFCSNWERSRCLPPVPIMKKLLSKPDFPKDIFVSMLKEDLIESHMQKYQDKAGRKLTPRQQRIRARKNGTKV